MKKLTNEFRSISKFMKNHFVIEDNVIDKKLIKLVDQKSFTSRKQLKNIIN